MKENLDAGNKMRTYTGKYIDVFNMNINDIDIVDIAHSLSLSSRWNGHTKEHYSIAEHSIWMAENAETLEEKLECLIHDATEAYIVDVPTPIKRRLPQYVEVEEKLNEIICKKFDVKFPFSKNLKKLDRKALEFEWNNKVLNNNFKSLSHQEAEYRFLELFYEITNELKNKKRIEEISRKKISKLNFKLGYNKNKTLNFTEAVDFSGLKFVDIEHKNIITDKSDRTIWRKIKKVKKENYNANSVFPFYFECNGKCYISEKLFENK
jgi:hypothetical protein